MLVVAQSRRAVPGSSVQVRPFHEGPTRAFRSGALRLRHAPSLTTRQGSPSTKTGDEILGKIRLLVSAPKRRADSPSRRIHRRSPHLGFSTHLNESTDP